MNSRERLITALRCEEPERVPFLESVVEEKAAVALLNLDGTGDILQDHWLKKAPLTSDIVLPMVMDTMPLISYRIWG